MIEKLVDFFIWAIQSMGYWGVFILMTMESMILPVPSEAVMPFAGFLVHQGVFRFWTVVVVSVVASIVGSLISYTIGYYGGKPFVHRWGKYFLLKKSHLEWTHTYFEKNGSITIFVARFIPVVRHLISIPAGIAKMDIKRFILFTAIGAAIWNTFLLYVGMKFAENWQKIITYSRFLDIVVIVVIVLFVIYHLKEPIKKRLFSKK
jgi:membrane protein DedA with SNARE-associated domain